MVALSRTRPYLSGMCIWTGFDYRGEPTPFGWPAIASQFGILDLCGFPKDGFYYYQETGGLDEPVLHVLPHWNWPGKEGQEISVWAHGNCDEVELFLNGVSQGRKKMDPGHLEWDVNYAPGTLLARGYKDGMAVLTDTVVTTGAPSAMKLTPDRSTISADGKDISVFTVAALDSKGRVVPTAEPRQFRDHRRQDHRRRQRRSVFA